MKAGTAILLVAALAACSDRTARRAEPPAGPAGPVVDHHVHLLSPRLVEDWKSLGVPFSHPDSVYTSLAGLLSDPALEGAMVASMGYLYGSASFRQQLALGPEEELAGVRREHDHLASEVRRAPGRVRGFCAVNPRRPYALGELTRCRDSLGLRGVKLHLGSADVDPRDTAHVAAVAAVAAWAETSHLPLLLHLDPERPELDLIHLEPLVSRVIDAHPALEVIVAHLGGSGGYGEWTRQVFRRLTRIPAAGRAAPVWFELSAVVLDRPSEGVPPTTAAEAAQLARDLEAAGLDRILFGTDYPLFTPAAYAETLRSRVPLGPGGWERVFANRIRAR